MSEKQINLGSFAKSKQDSTVPKSERTREAILAAAIEFLWTRPFRLMTVSGLMSSTNVGRSAFYQYFTDLQELMEALFRMLETEFLTAASPWILKPGDPVALVRESLTNVVNVGYQRGPFIKAMADAAAAEERMESAWLAFIRHFDEAVAARIRADQEQGLVAAYDSGLAAHSLNLLNAFTFISTFGRHPRGAPAPTGQVLIRIWVSTLYGSQWAESEHSSLIRTH